ncbi:hypothetical protein NBRGN_052_00070 [Nocardia brasiliensis NBRC 14402]|uniref:hypothetical protein n=1 Tax=Nocardia brasiliensis TaxID=37326 RepID=UPI00045C6C22|nr:hypothetical protein [Nocardia brasiliensis]GAJ82219.1 hypothetical protein NBRGN_052_00070 [Nocardia brasiliensis NBRC 14402]
MDTPGTPDPFHPAESHPGSREDDAVRRLEHVGRAALRRADGGAGGREFYADVALWTTVGVGLCVGEMADVHLVRWQAFLISALLITVAALGMVLFLDRLPRRSMGSTRRMLAIGSVFVGWFFFLGELLDVTLLRWQAFLAALVIIAVTGAIVGEFVAYRQRTQRPRQ